MIFIFVTGLIVILALRTPWSSMHGTARTWAIMSFANTTLVLVFPAALEFAPGHPRPEIVTDIGYGVSIVLTIAGVALWWQAGSAHRALTRWLPPLLVAAMPVALWTAVGLLFYFGSASRG